MKLKGVSNVREEDIFFLFLVVNLLVLPAILGTVDFRRFKKYVLFAIRNVFRSIYSVIPVKRKRRSRGNKNVQIQRYYEKKSFKRLES